MQIYIRTFIIPKYYKKVPLNISKNILLHYYTFFLIFRVPGTFGGSYIFELQRKWADGFY